MKKKKGTTKALMYKLRCFLFGTIPMFLWGFEPPFALRFRCWVCVLFCQNSDVSLKSPNGESAEIRHVHVNNHFPCIIDGGPDLSVHDKLDFFFLIK